MDPVTETEPYHHRFSPSDLAMGRWCDEKEEMGVERKKGMVSGESGSWGFIYLSAACYY